jgi:cytosine/adenosine deaminase-related metal-dependent hydrolase
MAPDAGIPPPRPVPQRTLLVRDALAVATLNPQLGEIRDGAIFVRGNVIEWVGSSDAIPEQYQQADEVLSLPGRVIMPGMVNTHHHMFQSLTRCVAQVGRSAAWAAGRRQPDTTAPLLAQRVQLFAGRRLTRAPRRRRRRHCLRSRSCSAGSKLCTRPG